MKAPLLQQLSRICVMRVISAKTEEERNYWLKKMQEVDEIRKTGF